MIVPFLLLAATAAALPQGAHQLAAGGSNHCLPGVPCDDGDICELKWKVNDTSQIAIVYEETGAESWFRSWLKSNGVKNWSEELLDDVIGGGYDCRTFPESDCGPAITCYDYSPNKAFYIHQSMATLYTSYERIREFFQDLGIESLASGIKDVVDIYGPPPQNDDYIWSLLIGAFVLGSVFTSGAMSSIMTGLVGIANIAAGKEAQKPKPKTPLDYNNALEDTLGDFYGNFTTTLDTTVTSVFGGDFSKLEIDDDPIDFLVNTFKDGHLLYGPLVGEQVDAWVAGMKRVVYQGFVIQALKMDGYYVSQRYDITEKECARRKQSVWMHNRCTDILKQDGPTMTGPSPMQMSDKKYKALTETYKLNYKEAIQNAIECAALPEDQRDTPHGMLDAKTKFTDKVTLPECFVNLRVKEEDFYGRPKSDYDDDNDNDNHIDPQCEVGCI